AEKKSRKDGIITTVLSVFISVAIVMAIVLFMFDRKTKETEEISKKTQHNLRTIVNLVGEKQMKVRIAGQLRSLIQEHKDYILKFNPGSWKKNYSDNEIDEMSIEIVRAFRDKNVQPELIMAIFASEDMTRRHRTSPKGAEGSMQLMPMTVDFIIKNEKLDDIDAFDPSDSMMLASFLIRDIRHYGSKYYGYFGDWGIHDIAGGYNAGINKYGSYLYVKHTRPKEAYLNKETTEYIKKVDFYYNNFISEIPNYKVVYERDIVGEDTGTNQ
ncbi:MAG TPA: lytic transglycosylase domain-containing protein, partial [Vampirovibrionales bacterium]